jgi:hypothetical protein
LVAIPLVDINVILWMITGEYYMNGSWWLLYEWLLVTIILMAIGGYWWLFY